MKKAIILSYWILFFNVAQAEIKPGEISFELRTEKESYYEGEKITFFITITNRDQLHAHPVLLPHSQNAGQNLFYLNAYDKAKNSMLLRYTEDKSSGMRVQDSGMVHIRYLKPLEKVVLPLYLNDFENDSNALNQNASQHSFGVPLFAGIYNINVVYNPYGVALGDSIYNYYKDTDTQLPTNGKLAMPESGDLSNLCTVKIKRRADTIVRIERQNYYIKTDGYYYYYFSQYVEKLHTTSDYIHVTNLLADSCAMPIREYFYSQFPERFNEYIARFDDGDIREYRKFTNWCPDYLYTERYNAFKQKTNYELQLPDKRYYSISYNQPSGTIHQESYCSEDGTRCQVTSYIYTKKGKFVKKKVQVTEPCSIVIIDGKKRSATRVSNLEEE